MMRALHLLLGIAILISISFSFDSAYAGAGPSVGDLLAIERNGLSLHTISPTDGSVISTVTISLTGETIEGGTGLAVDPTTGTLYALLKIDGDNDRVLVTIDPATGVATLVGSVGFGFAGIAFDNTGTLFGVTGDADFKPIPGEQFFFIDKTTGIPTLLCDLGNGSAGENIVFNPLDGKMYHFSGRGTQVFETIDDTSGVTCGVTDIPLSGDFLDKEPTGMVFSIPDGLFFVSTTVGKTFNSLTTGGFATELGDTVGVSDDVFKGLAILVPPPLPPGGGKGSSSYQDPNLGDVRHGNGHDNGFCHFTNCMNVDGFFNHFPETIIPQGSTQSFTILVNCPRGASTCNHISLGGGLPDSDFYDDQWTVTIDRQVRSDNWDLTVYNPYGEIDGDAVSVTVQSVGQSFVTATFNIPFLIPGSVGTHDGIGDPHENNRHLHVTVWDSNGGVSNYIFNEGIYVDDIFAYPQVETSYDEPIEYEPLCLNENPNKRYTCAFDLVKEWTTKQAEEKLKQIYNEHNYEIVTDESEQN